MRTWPPLYGLQCACARRSILCLKSSYIDGVKSSGLGTVDFTPSMFFESSGFCSPWLVENTFYSGAWRPRLWSWHDVSTETAKRKPPAPRLGDFRDISVPFAKRCGIGKPKLNELERPTLFDANLASPIWSTVCLCKAIYPMLEVVLHCLVARPKKGCRV